MERADENMVNAGIIFMFTAWVQGQMTDLFLLKNHPHLIKDFVDNPERIPDEYHKLRVEYWEKQFGDIKKEFIKAFSEQLSDDEKAEVEAIYHLRNMIAHAHVSVGRDYMVHRPRNENKMVLDLSLESIEDQAEPLLVKIELWKKDKFNSASKLISKFENLTLKRLAGEVGVPHSRLR